MDLQRITCNRQAIERFLADQLSDEEQGAFEDHLESCLACREYLDSTAADASWWQETRGYLASDAEPPRPADGISEEVLSPLYGLKNFLAPTDDPRMLGKLGGYDVVGVVGCGGMGVVLKAFDAPLHRYVAIKVLGPQLALSAAARQRFAREAKAGATVVHPNVMAIHAVAEANGLPYFVMPYVRGPSLEKRLQQTGALAVVEVVRIGMQIASGLAAAHAQGLVHRDIKPANILLEEGVERVTITDFGLARAVDDASLTKSGVIAGTPQFMSPEQASGQPVDHRSDLFSLGSVLYALCTGRPPFRADTTLAVLQRVEEGRPRPIREINPDVPAWLAGIVERLQARDPADRFQSAAEVAALLERWLAHLHQPLLVPAPVVSTPPAGASPKTKGTGRRSRLLALLGAVALLAGVGLAGPFLFQLVVPPRPEPLVALNQDFRDGRRPQPPLKLCGTGVVAASKPESGGLRITVPAGRVAPATDIPGVMMDLPIKGDFEITAGYELLQADRPATGNGVGFELYLMTDTPTQEAVAFMRSVRVKEGNVYSCARMTTTDGQRRYRNHFVPTASNSGRLRLTRTGKEVVFWAADETGSFRALIRHDLGPEDVRLVRLAANTGSAQVPLDLRIVDLKIRANSPLSAPPPPAAGRLDHAVAIPVEAVAGRVAPRRAGRAAGSGALRASEPPRSCQGRADQA